MGNPKISVIMSVCNGEKFLRETMDSIMKQTFSDFEFIIFDDASSDSTSTIIESYRDRRVVLIKNAYNLGLTINLNRGIEIARGEYIARVDADDICLSQRFEKQVEFLDNNLSIAVAGSNAIIFGDFDRVTDMPLNHEEIKSLLLFENCLIHPSVMIRKSTLDNNNLKYDESFKHAQDYDLWVRCSKSVRLANIKEPLIKYRKHGGQISQSILGSQNEFADRTRENQLRELGLELLYGEKKIYFNYLHGEVPQTAETILLLEKAFIKILRANVKQKIYDNKIISRLLGRYWYSVCLSHARRFSKIARLYWKSELRKYYKSTLSKNIKMGAACLISYK